MIGGLALVPLAMFGAPDLAPESSIGVRAEAGVALGFDEPITLLALQIDAQVAIGDNLTLFAAYPIDAARAYGDATVGVGNFTLGALGAFDVADGWRVGAGASAAYGATVDGTVGLLLHFELPAYDRENPVVHGFAAARAAGEDSFVELRVEHTHDAATELPGARLAGGLHAGDYWLVGEARALHDFDAGETILGLDLGVRGRFPGRPVESWCVRAGVAHFEDVTSLSGDIEVRTW